jgi:RNA polymerase sigma-70 factor (ECF subfamily)
MRAMKPDEAAILAALDRGDPDRAASEAIRRLGPQILGYLTRVLGSADDAADAFSLFSEQLWRGMRRFERRSSVRVWAYRVAWTAAMRVAEDGWRRRRERLRTSMASRLAAEVLSSAPHPGAPDGLQQLRSALRPDERSLLVLRVDQRLSWKEVAEVMREEGEAVDEAALRKRFERVKRRLAEIARSSGLLGSGTPRQGS